MKFLAAFALLSVAVAAQVEPITLPKAPLPEVVRIEPVALPKAALPEVAQAYVQQPEPIDIRPLMVPQEIVEALRRAELAGEVPFDAVRVVESADVAPVEATLEEQPEVPSGDAAPFDAVRIVEYADLAAPLTENAQVEGVKVVSIEDIAALLAGAAVDAVKVVEVAEDAAPVLQDVAAEEDLSAVRFVDEPPRYPAKQYDSPMWR